MIDTGYLFAKDSKRIFINTCLGCTGSCSYCYLSQIGYSNNEISSKVKRAEELIKQIETQVPISKDTLVTLGCFSECWDTKNKEETIQLIQYFLKRGNQIQLSTKKKIECDEIEAFAELIEYLGQLVINVSSATINRWREFERGTDSPEERFKTFEISSKFPIPTVLYIKPVLEGITKKEILEYKKVIQQYRIKDVVVGSIFEEENPLEEKMDMTVPFSNQGELFYYPIPDELEMKRSFMQLGNIRVFSKSTEVTKYYKERNQQIARE